MIILTLSGKTLEEDLKVLDSEKGRTDGAELRVDELLPEERGKAVSFPGKTGLPVVLSLRRASDGGSFAGEENERAGLIRRLLPGGFRYIELEEDLPPGSIDLSGVPEPTTIIRSFYDTGKVPFPLLPRMEKLSLRPGEIPKVSVTPRGTGELVYILKQAGEWKREERIIETCGPYGTPGRVLLPFFGSLFTFAAMERDFLSGNYTPWELSELYRVKNITRNTKIFGVFGNPIAQSLSPKIHNPAYALQGFDGVYLPFLVDDWASGMELAELLEIRGISVTAPHKGNAADSSLVKDEQVRKISASNTMVRGEWGYSCHNTDIAGFITALTEQLRRDGRLSSVSRAGKELSGYDLPLPPLEGSKALVIGAGGAARGVVYALSVCGCSVTVTNRTFAKAEDLAEKFNAKAEEMGKAAGKGGKFDIILQTTSLGMERAGKKGAPQWEQEMDPLPEYSFSGKETVMDIIYKPAETPFLRRARKAGCSTENGLAMLVAQAMHQYRFFTGLEYPLSLPEALDRIKQDQTP